MHSLPLAPGPHGPSVRITRVADQQWHAVADDQVLGRGDAAQRFDGRLFISIDAWHDAAFDGLAAAMLADLPAPLHTVVDESDLALVSHWKRLGFRIARRERSYRLPTDPAMTGLVPVPPPSGITIVPAGQAHEGPLRVLDRTIRDEVEATAGWRTMPAEVLPPRTGTTVVDPSAYVAAAESGRYVGLLRVARVPRRPRIGLIAVRADRQRRGVARAMLAQALNALHTAGEATAWAEVDESNGPAAALFEGAGAERAGGVLELVRD
ncbi:GNAT family N-acetyltransferase [Streptomyces sp. NPDC048111]|uniref:GNAT family N-acetyltransferase n=1 Tax=Streptomyces sp. NPDC048111 TaxID=3365500 RepID=UPI0037219C8D